MNYFSCERPWAFYGLLVLVPVVIITLVRYLTLVRSNSFSGAPIFTRMKRAILSRLVWWSAAWCMLIAAFSGLSWGVELETVRQTGTSVSFVFDVSWSMTAQDVAGKHSAPMTRLEAVASYTEGLLDRLGDSDVSAIIAKGDGMVAVPQTSDKNAVRSLLPSLSPQLMTSTGSSIGGGISSAASVFPVLSTAARTIIVFTDGEETDGTMLQAAEDVVQAGIQLIFIGFGSESETEIIAGDGTTRVQTALRRDSLESTVETVNKSVQDMSQRFSGLDSIAAKASFIPAQQAGSAHAVLEAIKENSGSETTASTVYEMRGIPRWPLFCILAVVFLFVGFIWTEFDASRFHAHAGKNICLLVLLLGCGLLQGCDVDWKGSAGILEGAFHWHRKDYREAVVNFMTTADYAESQANTTLQQYSVFGLAATYLAQGETEAAMSRIKELSPDTPQNIRFAALYNAGIISYRNGKYEEAASLFKQALLVDSSNVNAKINLELSLGHEPVRSAEGTQEIIPVEEKNRESPLESTIFSLIREKEQKIWKNQQSQEKSDSNIDY